MSYDIDHSPRVTGEETQASKKDKRKEIARRVQIGMGVAGLAVSVLAVGGALVINHGNNVGAQPVDRSIKDPSISGPQVPGEVDAGEYLSGNGIELTAEQAAAYESGDIEAQNGVLDETITPALNEAFAAYALGDTDKVDISRISSDPKAQDIFEQIITDAGARVNEQPGTGKMTVWVCNANIPDTANGMCKYFPTDYRTTDRTGRLATEFALQVLTISHPGGLSPTNEEQNLAKVPYYPNFDGTRLKLVPNS